MQSREHLHAQAEQYSGVELVLPAFTIISTTGYGMVSRS
jgi:hypothetical protein